MDTALIRGVLRLSYRFRFSDVTALIMFECERHKKMPLFHIVLRDLTAPHVYISTKDFINNNICIFGTMFFANIYEYTENILISHIRSLDCKAIPGRCFLLRGYLSHHLVNKTSATTAKLTNCKFLFTGFINAVVKP